VSMYRKGWLLVLTGVVLTANAQVRERDALFGMGSARCGLFVYLHANSSPVADDVFSWVEGWLSAKNYIGHEDHPLAVGRSLSAPTLLSMMVDQCQGIPTSPVWLAADELYVRLQQKDL
jgi:hypothetical protein